MFQLTAVKTDCTAPQPARCPSAPAPIPPAAPPFAIAVLPTVQFRSTRGHSDQNTDNLAKSTLRRENFRIKQSQKSTLWQVPKRDLYSSQIPRGSTVGTDRKGRTGTRIRRAQGFFPPYFSSGLG